MSLFSALGRWAKAFGYLLTGRVDQARKAIDANPHVMNAKYDEMIRTMQGKITQYINAASTVSAHVARKEIELARVNKEIEETERFRTGAVTIAKQVATKLQAAGKDTASDPEYAQHRAAFNDFSSTLGEKLKTKKELEDAITAGQETNRNHLFTLKNLKRELETLKKEKGEMVAEMISATKQAMPMFKIHQMNSLMWCRQIHQPLLQQHVLLTLLQLHQVN
jgi:RAB protein geranylgeranyltransferase component A